MAQPDRLQTAYDALTEDARQWNEHSDVMETAARQAASFGLTGFQFGYQANKLGVVAKYQEVQDLAVRLLSEGAVAMQEIADTLIQVRSDYEATDERSGGRILKAGEEPSGHGRLGDAGAQGAGQIVEKPGDGSGRIEDRTGQETPGQGPLNERPGDGSGQIEDRTGGSFGRISE